MEAEGIARELAALQPDSPWARHALGWTLVSLRRFDQARRVLEEEIDAHRGSIAAGAPPLRYSCLLAAAGRHEEARALLRAAAPEPAADGQGLVVAAETLCLLDDAAGALDALEGAIAAAYDDPYFLLIDPLLEVVRDDPALDRLVPVS